MYLLKMVLSETFLSSADYFYTVALSDFSRHLIIELRNTFSSLCFFLYDDYELSRFPRLFQIGSNRNLNNFVITITILVLAVPVCVVRWPRSHPSSDRNPDKSEMLGWMLVSVLTVLR